MGNIDKQSDLYRSASSFKDYINLGTADRLKRVLAVLYKEIRLILEELKTTTPKWTGAAAGDAAGARVSMYASHPAANLKIGNELGDSGWQIYPAKAPRTGFALVNPMWDDYLFYVETGIAFNHRDQNSHFVQRAWYNHLSRRPGRKI